ncbi:L,D-transpeptidase [Clostridium felsineum]|uniref:L,D-transpeptidase n=1 Tax=Clostridium felsineum TaxID=36839 RepID=UPI00214DED0B|nr:L,D-transpeptidase [Clostridium felsineum]
MKKEMGKFLLSCVISSIITCIIILAPIFFTKDDKPGDFVPPSTSYENKVKAEVTEKMKYKFKDNISVFSSKDCIKNTYYISNDNVQLVVDIDKPSSKIYTLNKGEEVVATKEKSGYIYCETNHVDEYGIFINGWVKKNINNVTGVKCINYDTLIDVDITSQSINVYKNNVIVNKKPIKCSTGVKGDNYKETPIGIFSVKKKVANLSNKREGENGMYGIQFFSDYFLNSVSFNEVKKDDKIVYDENIREINNLGKSDTNGGIRLSLEDSRYIYNLVTDKSAVSIHY